MKRFWLLPWPILFLFFFPSLLFSQERNLESMGKAPDRSELKTALVIGNGSYKIGPLGNSVNDASDIADALSLLGFEVDSLTNADKGQMLKAIDNFGSRLKRRGGVGLFYFAGHGSQVDGDNYLVPLRTTIREEHQYKYRAVNVGEVLGEMHSAGNRLNIVILDCCRNNPFERSFRSGSRGLAYMDAPRGTLIAYATAPNNTAADGSGRNSPYTGSLLTVMKQPGLKIEEVFKQVRIQVLSKTNNVQEPWESTSLVGDFYFFPPTLPVDHLEPRQTLPTVQPSYLPRSYTLRSEPQALSSDDVETLLERKDFFYTDRSWTKGYYNPHSKGIVHNYETRTIQGEKVVIDHATGLMWQQSGSTGYDNRYEEALEFIADLNRRKFAGYSDWRLPTLEEALSVIEPKPTEKNSYLKIDQAFDSKQTYIWTADGPGRDIWHVHLGSVELSDSTTTFPEFWQSGPCRINHLTYINACYVRAVRSVQSVW